MADEVTANPSIQTSRWNPGSQYIVAVRGGPNGLRTQGGGGVEYLPARRQKEA